MEAVTREELFLAAAAGQDVSLPEPVTRRELFLKAIVDAVRAGGTSDEAIQEAVNAYLEENPVSGGTGTWKKLAEVTLEEAVFNAEVTITEDISEVIFVITQLGGDTAAQVMAVRAWGCDTNVFLLGTTSTSTSNQRATVRLRKITLDDGSAYVDFLNYVYSASASQGTTGSAMGGNMLIEAKGSTFGIKKVAAGNTLPVGFSYYILGR